jgi:hypothetical protein
LSKDSETLDAPEILNSKPYFMGNGAQCVGALVFCLHNVVSEDAAT